MTELTELLYKASDARDELCELYEQILNTSNLKAVIQCAHTNRDYHLGDQGCYKPGKLDRNSSYFTIVGTTCPVFSIYDIISISKMSYKQEGDYLLIRVA